MQIARDVFITIGKKNYTLRTPLDLKELDRVKILIDQACGNLDRSTGQEDLLVLTCLRLAYTLDSVGSKLDDALKLLDNH